MSVLRKRLTPYTVAPVVLGAAIVGFGHSVAFGEPAATSSLVAGFNAIAGGGTAGFGAWAVYEGMRDIFKPR